MTRHEDMTTARTERTGQAEQATTGVGTTRPRRRTGRPARVAAATAAVLAAGALVVGCGGKDTSSASPDRSGGDAAPAGSAQSDAKGGDADGKDHKSTGGSGGSGTSGSAGSGEKADTGAASDNGTRPQAGKAAASSQHGAGTSGACTTADLKGEIGPNHPGAGQENFALVLTNDSGKTCTVRGFPGFAFLNGDGEQVSLDPNREGPSGKSIKLAPGKSAWAPLSFTNPQMTDVPTVTPDTALLTPPDQRTSLTLDWKGGPVTATGKASVPKIGALTPGTGA